MILEAIGSFTKSKSKISDCHIENPLYHTRAITGGQWSPLAYRDPLRMRRLWSTVKLLTSWANFSLILSLGGNQWDLLFFFCPLLNHLNAPVITHLIYPRGYLQQGLEHSFVDSCALLKMQEGLIIEHQYAPLWFFPSHICINYLLLCNIIGTYLTVFESKEFSSNLVGCLRVCHEVAIKVSTVAAVIWMTQLSVCHISNGFCWSELSEGKQRNEKT